MNNRKITLLGPQGTNLFIFLIFLIFIFPIFALRLLGEEDLNSVTGIAIA